MSSASPALPAAATTIPALDACGVGVVLDSVKGRCLQALQDFEVGTIILTESAVVYASFEDEEEDLDGFEAGDDGSLPDTAVDVAVTAAAAAAAATTTSASVLNSNDGTSKSSECGVKGAAATPCSDWDVVLRRHREPLEPDLEQVAIGNVAILRMIQERALCSLHEYRRMSLALEPLDGVESLDTARNFLQLLALQCASSHRSKAVPSDASPEEVPRSSSCGCDAPIGGTGILGQAPLSVDDLVRFFGFPAPLAVQMPLLQALSPNPNRGLEKCTTAATILRRNFPTSRLLEHVKDEQAGRLLGVLNNNQMELESLGGSGLFPTAAILEHSCAPTCSFTTEGSRLFLTCIRPLKRGQRLSIDYGNLHYRPTSERRAFTLEKYGFPCTCERCVGQPDFTRAFRCPSRACAGKVKAVLFPQPPTSKPAAAAFDGAASGGAGDCSSAEVETETSGGIVSSWTSCPNCHQTPSAQQVAAWELMEQDLAQRLGEPVDSLLGGSEEAPSRSPPSLTEIQVLAGLLPPAKGVAGSGSTSRKHAGKGRKKGSGGGGNKKRKAAGSRGGGGSGGGSNNTASPGGGGFHVSHYLIFDALNEVAFQNSRRDPKTAQEAYQALLGMLDAEDHRVLPAVHFERVLYCDKLGQVAVANGAQSVAEKAWATAYQLSRRACGEDVPMTKKMLRLKENVPQSIHELMEHFAT